MIKASKAMLETGHEIIGGYPEICWNMPCEEQYDAMSSVKEYMESLPD